MSVAAHPVLELRDLRVEFHGPRSPLDVLRLRSRPSVAAVAGVSLVLERGEMLALVGASGSGKTTTGLAILGSVPIAAGAVLVAGVGPRRGGRGERERLRAVQMIFQDPYDALDPRFDVRATIAESLAVQRIGRRGPDRERRIADALRRVSLTPPEQFLHRYPHQLSGGQRQRVAIAAALVLEPELLVADEPVSMLDVSVRAGILGLLDELKRSGLAVLMITHDLSTAAQFADRVAVMHRGRIVEQGPVRQVLGAPRHPYTRALIDAVPHPDPDRPPSAAFALEPVGTAEESPSLDGALDRELGRSHGR